MTEAEKRAKKKYRAKGKRFTVEFYPTEADLIAHLEKQEKKQTYIKELIRADIERNEADKVLEKAHREAALLGMKQMLKDHEKFKEKHPRPKHRKEERK